MVEETKKLGSIFKWQEDSFIEKQGIQTLGRRPNLGQEATICQWCGGHVKYYSSPSAYAVETATSYSTSLAQCQRCAWYFETSERINHSLDGYEVRGHFNLLRRFRIDDEDEVTLSELGTYLRSSFSDVYSINTRRLEELVEDVFRNLGYRTKLTQQTRDGGADIILLDSGGGREAIVEVKRFYSDRRIGIELVRQLIGAQLLLAARKSYFVTTSSFTDGARKAANSPNLSKEGLEVELWSGLRLLQMLSCYNEEILAVNAIKTDIPLQDQLPPDYAPPLRVLKAPWNKFYGKRVSYVKGEEIAE